MSDQESQTQPPPLNKGENVPEAFRKWSLEHGHPEAHALSEKRDAFGQSKYGQPLMTKDGRDTVQDIEEEIGDMFHYLYKAKMNGENVDKLKKYVPVILDLFAEFD